MQPAPSWGFAALTMMLHRAPSAWATLPRGRWWCRDRTGQLIPEERVVTPRRVARPPRLADAEFAALSWYGSAAPAGVRVRTQVRET